MSTLKEIEAALPKLSDRELKQLAADLDNLFRQRKGANIYHDTYGDVTEADVILSAERAFLDYDRDEEKNAGGQAR
ncbi:MAG TPA: hypothetical protein VLZ12_15525 [Verrucomicrobiae bacterium]|nr:hypothetical protein [Verrucomicrobiae bacterium]